MGWAVVLLAISCAAIAATEECSSGITPLPETVQSSECNTLFVNTIPRDDAYFQVVIEGATQANLSFGEWKRFAVNNSLFDGGITPGTGTITINNPSDYPSGRRQACANSAQLAYPSVNDSMSWGAVGFQANKSNIIAIVPAQAGSRAASAACTWTPVQIAPSFTVPGTVLRLTLGSFVTPMNTSYQTPIAFQTLCTKQDTGVTSWTSTTFPGFQEQIPLVSGCTNSAQGCYFLSSYWNQTNYTQLISVGIADPAGTGSKIVCTKVRAVDLSQNNRSIGEFSLRPWSSAMAGSTMLLAVLGNTTSNLPPLYNSMELRNYWTFGDLCTGDNSAKMQLIPPPPPPPQNLPLEIGWAFVYILAFLVLVFLVGAVFRGCRRSTDSKFSPQENVVAP